jgi:hypothetical protein
VKFYGVNNIRKTVINTTESTVPTPNPFEFETGNLNFRTNKPPGTRKIPVEVFQVESRTEIN